MTTGYLHKALTEVVLNALPQTLHHKLDSWMEVAGMTLSVKTEGEGLRLAELKYTSALHLEDIPFAQVDTASLFAQIAAWLADNDEARDGLSPDEQQVLIDTHKVDDSKIDIDIDVMFIETLTLVPDVQGAIVLDNRRWRLDTPVLNVAEHLDVVVTPDGA